LSPARHFYASRTTELPPLPSFRGIEALAVAGAKLPDIPFILVSGHTGERAAIEAFTAGVTDIVLKDDLIV
jgi:two-component system OmpR family sensor kinase